ncbi:hypothetical protein B0T18DRAFT_386867 [Schizothecium vesticola]|uniref:Uncharacterized protein n=1 Tax=Schizothecium vesticola TaxID=314040 RepID=A0AA40FC64_9PEZI|nr:hypothetical protein B0T18DRAFT_386867 [Schizothecium vesticola]
MDGLISRDKLELLRDKLGILRDDISVALIFLQKDFNLDITGQQRASAGRFFEAVLSANHKYPSIYKLEDDPLIVAAVSLQVRELTNLRHQEELARGASRIAEWSSWPRDEALKTTLADVRLSRSLQASAPATGLESTPTLKYTSLRQSTGLELAILDFNGSALLVPPDRQQAP